MRTGTAGTARRAGRHRSISHSAARSPARSATIIPQLDAIDDERAEREYALSHPARLIDLDYEADDGEDDFHVSAWVDRDTGELSDGHVLTVEDF